jgi:hypothetical protein
MSKKILAPISQAEIEARISGHLDKLLAMTTQSSWVLAMPIVSETMACP